MQADLYWQRSLRTSETKKRCLLLSDATSLGSTVWIECAEVMFASLTVNASLQDDSVWWLLLSFTVSYMRFFLFISITCPFSFVPLMTHWTLTAYSLSHFAFQLLVILVYIQFFQFYIILGKSPLHLRLFFNSFLVLQPPNPRSEHYRHSPSYLIHLDLKFFCFSFCCCCCF